MNSEKPQRILICDDDPAIVKALRVYLEEAGFFCGCAYTGRQALTALNDEEDYDLVLLDIMMPDLDGISALQKIRLSYTLPIIMLTAKAEETDKIGGLSLGADDYITKPFSSGELVARVKSQLRRYTRLGGKPPSDATYHSGGLEVNAQTGEVKLDGDVVKLTAIEFQILSFLLEHKGQIFSSAALYAQVWKNSPSGSENVIAVHICHIREKIEINPKEPVYLKVIWGRGYKLEDLDE